MVRKQTKTITPPDTHNFSEQTKWITKHQTYISCNNSEGEKFPHYLFFI